MEQESELTREQYNNLPLKKALEYTTISTYVCETDSCKQKGNKVVRASNEPPHDMLYAKEKLPDGNFAMRLVGIKRVCKVCMVAMTCEDDKYFHTDKSKYRINTPKAKGDRASSYYRDFTKNSSNTQQDPELFKNVSTKVTKKDEAAFARNMKGKL